VGMIGCRGVALRLFAWRKFRSSADLPGAQQLIHGGGQQPSVGARGIMSEDVTDGWSHYAVCNRLLTSEIDRGTHSRQRSYEITVGTSPFACGCASKFLLYSDKSKARTHLG